MAEDIQRALPNIPLVDQDKCFVNPRSYVDGTPDILKRVCPFLGLVLH